jgi:hypothetical protein
MRPSQKGNAVSQLTAFPFWEVLLPYQFSMKRALWLDQDQVNFLVQHFQELRDQGPRFTEMLSLLETLNVSIKFSAVLSLLSDTYVLDLLGLVLLFSSS